MIQSWSTKRKSMIQSTWDGTVPFALSLQSRNVLWCMSLSQRTARSIGVHSGFIRGLDIYIYPCALCKWLFLAEIGNVRRHAWDCSNTVLWRKWSFAARTTVPRRSWTFVNVQSSSETDRMIPANGDVCFVLNILEHLPTFFRSVHVLSLWISYNLVGWCDFMCIARLQFSVLNCK